MSSMDEAGGEKRWPGECDDENPAEFVTIPKQPTRQKPGQLTEEQLKHYFEVVSEITWFGAWLRQETGEGMNGREQAR
jgi:hypothetical protein